MVNCYGFTLLRNGIKYDYSFVESLESLSGVTKKIYVALGSSEDGTEEVVSKLSFVESIPTVWDDKLREGGLILSQQTNIALNHAKKNHENDPNAWGFYLQCDEVLHEGDFDLIKEDFEKANEQGCDAIAFRYLHFWMDHHSIAINKKWYPQEIRAVKLNCGLESWGDAQSFREAKKIYYSNARIFHYGHVREEDKYLEKKKDILRLYHSDEKLPKYKRREKRFDDQTEILDYWGTHPKFMHKRIQELGDRLESEKVGEVYILDKKELYLDSLISRINADQVNFVSKAGDVPKEAKKNLIIVEPNFWQNLRYPSKVPFKMRSKLALPWPRDFLLTLKLSEKGVGLRHF